MRSSTTARVSRKARKAEGRWVPRTARTASANAISVAAGMAHPRRACASPPPPSTTRMNSSDGTATPQAAAMIGTAAFAGSRKSPTVSSRLSSNPATKKKIASSPSAAQVPTLRSRWRPAGPMCVSRRAKYDSRSGELAQISANAAAASNKAPPTVSVRKAAATDLASGQEPRCRMRVGMCTGTPQGRNSLSRPDFPAHRYRR